MMLSPMLAQHLHHPLSHDHPMVCVLWGTSRRVKQPNSLPVSMFHFHPVQPVVNLEHPMTYSTITWLLILEITFDFAPFMAVETVS